ncbi:hypothetical protein HPB48_018245 [Haemaphysalis longicornis]|uniref:Uncharacterized protein n=1 Tax=Haemaphysalis longicornis TaxID=44386 RepID=A0A9J6F706_HAELO|nr:hypothetical protein HPB48_018245 [Haemaphysalis longicornis]
MLAQLTCLVVLPPLEERLRDLDWDRDCDREFLRDEEVEPRRTGVFPGLRRRRPRGGAGCCSSPGAWDAARCRASSFCRLTYGSQNRCGQPLDAVRCSPLHREQQGLHTWPSTGSLVPQVRPPCCDMTQTEKSEATCSSCSLQPTGAAKLECAHCGPQAPLGGNRAFVETHSILGTTKGGVDEGRSDCPRSALNGSGGQSKGSSSSGVTEVEGRTPDGVVSVDASGDCFSKARELRRESTTVAEIAKSLESCCDSWERDTGARQAHRYHEAHYYHEAHLRRIISVGAVVISAGYILHKYFRRP